MDKELLKQLNKEQLIDLLLRQEEVSCLKDEVIEASEIISDKWRRVVTGEYNLGEAYADLMKLV